MAGNQYYSNSNTGLFSVEDDVDDYEFLSHPKTGLSGYMLPHASQTSSSNVHITNSIDDLEERRLKLLQKRKEIEQRTVQSTQRSLSYLRNSEEVGIATAEELVRQREQLERTERRLDDINTTLRFSQKHLQGIKSVFGGLMNKFSGKPGGSELPNKSSYDNNSRSPLNDVIDRTSTELQNSSYVHPGVEQRNVTPTDHQQVIDKNLDVMTASISRLKGLAHELGEEIHTHNDLIENVITKAEKADTSLSRQNKDIKRLLK